MNQSQSPIKVAMQSSLICVLVGAVVVATDRDVLTNPLRMAILIGVAVLVPIANYLILRRRLSRREG